MKWWPWKKNKSDDTQKVGDDHLKCIKQQIESSFPRLAFLTLDDVEKEISKLRFDVNHLIVDVVNIRNDLHDIRKKQPVRKRVSKSGSNS